MATVNYGKTLAYPPTRGDVYSDLRAVEGIDAVTQALFRRFETDEGSVPWDRSFGYKLTRLVLDNEPDVQTVRSRVEAECKKDDRVSSATARVTWNRRTRTLKIFTDGTTGIGPFKFVASVSEISVEFLRG